MRYVLPTCLFALSVGASALSAQDTTITSKTKIEADDAKPMTVTGCLSGGPSSFTLSNVTPAAAAHEKAGVPHEKSSETPVVGTSGVIASYDLTPRGGVNLTPHVGQKVEITGVVIEPATGGDDDAKISVKEETRVKADDAPDQKVESTTKAEIARGPAPKLAVTSVKMVAQNCQ